MTGPDPRNHRPNCGTSRIESRTGRHPSVVHFLSRAMNLQLVNVRPRNLHREPPLTPAGVLLRHPWTFPAIVVLFVAMAFAAAVANGAVLPRGTDGVRATGAGDAAGAEVAGRPGRGAPRRSPYARYERPRVPRRGDGPVPARPASAAHRVRRHRRRDRSDQRRRPRPLPVEAVGSTRGEALPGRRLAHRHVAQQRRAARHPGAGRRAPLVGPIVRGA